MFLPQIKAPFFLFLFFPWDKCTDVSCVCLEAGWQTTLETLALSCNTPFIPGREVLIGGCGDEGGSVEARSVALMDKRMTHELYQ